MLFELLSRNQIEVESRLHIVLIYITITVKKNPDLIVQT